MSEFEERVAYFCVGIEGELDGPAEAPERCARIRELLETFRRGPDDVPDVPEEPAP